MSGYYDRVQAVTERLIEQAKLEIMYRISTGNVQSLDVYKFECGKIRGLEEANSIVSEAIRTVLGYDKSEEG